MKKASKLAATKGTKLFLVTTRTEYEHLYIVRASDGDAAERFIEQNLNTDDVELPEWQQQYHGEQLTGFAEEVYADDLAVMHVKLADTRWMGSPWVPVEDFIITATSRKPKTKTVKTTKNVSAK